MKNECKIPVKTATTLLETKNFLLLSARMTEEEAEETIEKGCKVRVLTAKEARE